MVASVETRRDTGILLSGGCGGRTRRRGRWLNDLRQTWAIVRSRPGKTMILGLPTPPYSTLAQGGRPNFALGARTGRLRPARTRCQVRRQLECDEAWGTVVCPVRGGRHEYSSGNLGDLAHHAVGIELRLHCLLAAYGGLSFQLC